MSAVGRRIALATLVTTALAVALTGCRVDSDPAASSPAPTPSPTIAASTPVGTPTPTATPTPSPTATAGADALPEKCTDLYSDGMLAALRGEVPPLNDPGVTMLSTQNADLLEIQQSGIPTLRCTWGAPSEQGIATTVALIDASQRATIVRTLRSAGFECGAYGDGTLCSVEERGITFGDVEYRDGEVHYVADDVWVATAWLNFLPEGYAPDIVANLGG